MYIDLSPFVLSHGILLRIKLKREWGDSKGLDPFDDFGVGLFVVCRMTS